MQYISKLPDDSVNVSKEKPLSTVLKLTASLALLVVIGYFIIGTVITMAITSVTPEQEQKLASMLSMDETYTETNSSYLQEIIQKLSLCAGLPYDIHVTVIEDKELNAYAVPGGRIIITRGLLKKMESENELAFVLGHELGHFKHKDHLRSLGYRIMLGTIGLMLGSDYGMVSSVTLGIGSAKYSQSAEYAADLFGLEVMQCTYGTVTEATRLFEKMDEGDEWRYFIATHPGFKARIKKMKEEIEKRAYNTEKKALPLQKI